MPVVYDHVLGHMIMHSKPCLVRISGAYFWVQGSFLLVLLSSLSSFYVFQVFSLFLFYFSRYIMDFPPILDDLGDFSDYDSVGTTSFSFNDFGLEEGEGVFR